MLCFCCAHKESLIFLAPEDNGVVCRRVQRYIYFKVRHRRVFVFFPGNGVVRLLRTCGSEGQDCCWVVAPGQAVKVAFKARGCQSLQKHLQKDRRQETVFLKKNARLFPSSGSRWKNILPASLEDYSDSMTTAWGSFPASREHSRSNVCSWSGSFFKHSSVARSV